MNIENLKKALEILRGEFNLKDSFLRSDLLLITGDLDVLINKLEHPKRTKRIEKLI